MPLTQCCDNSEYGASMTCTQTTPESSLQILCKCKESSQSNKNNGTTNVVRCNGTNCINRINTANEFEHINGVETEVITKTRYMSQQSTDVCFVYVCVSTILAQFYFFSVTHIKDQIEKNMYIW